MALTTIILIGILARLLLEDWCEHRAKQYLREREEKRRGFEPIIKHWNPDPPRLDDEEAPADQSSLRIAVDDAAIGRADVDAAVDSRVAGDA